MASAGLSQLSNPASPGTYLFSRVSLSFVVQSPLSCKSCYTILIIISSLILEERWTLDNLDSRHHSGAFEVPRAILLNCFTLIYRTWFTCPQLAITFALSISTGYAFHQLWPVSYSDYSYPRLLVLCWVRPANILFSWSHYLVYSAEWCLTSCIYHWLFFEESGHTLFITSSRHPSWASLEILPSFNVHYHDGFRSSTAHARSLVPFPCFVLPTKDHYSCRTL